MSYKELRMEIQEIARVTFSKPELIISDDMTADNVDTWTSLTFMQFLTAIEERFGFRFKMMELLKFQNMGIVIETVQNRCG